VEITSSPVFLCPFIEESEWDFWQSNKGGLFDDCVLLFVSRKVRKGAKADVVDCVMLFESAKNLGISTW